MEKDISKNSQLRLRHYEGLLNLQKEQVDSSANALTFDQQVFKLIFSRQSKRRISVPSNSCINVLSRMVQLKQNNSDFEFSYFYHSKLAFQVDWLTAISGKASSGSKNYQKRHRPTNKDWHNAIMKLNDSQAKIFVIVLDNVNGSRKFIKMKKSLINGVSLYKKYLVPTFKYLQIKRFE